MIQADDSGSPDLVVELASEASEGLRVLADVGSCRFVNSMLGNFRLMVRGNWRRSPSKSAHVVSIRSAIRSRRNARCPTRPRCFGPVANQCPSLTASEPLSRGIVGTIVP